MKLDALKFGLSCAIVWAAAVLVLGITGSSIGYGAGFVRVIGKLYLGYKMTPAGIVIGMIWAFADAGIGGWLVAALYNLLLGSAKK